MPLKNDKSFEHHCTLYRELDNCGYNINNNLVNRFLLKNFDQI